MDKPKQYITIIPLKGDDKTYAVATSRQYSVELAQRDLYMKLDEANIPCSPRAITRELIIDEDGVIRMVDDKGEVLPTDTWKI